MYAAIQRLSGGQEATDDTLRAARRLAADLSRRPGFVSFALLEERGQIGVAVIVFETAAELAEATGFAEAWAAEHLPACLSGMDQVASGEIVVQRGL